MNSLVLLTWYLIEKMELLLNLGTIYHPKETFPPPHPRFPQVHVSMYLRLQEGGGEKKQALAMGVMCRPLGDWFATQSREAAPRLRALASCREQQSLEKKKTIFSLFLSIQITLSHALLPWLRGPLRTANLRCHLSVQPWQAVTLFAIVRDDSSRPCFRKLVPLPISVAIGS